MPQYRIEFYLKSYATVAMSAFNFMSFPNDAEAISYAKLHAKRYKYRKFRINDVDYQPVTMQAQEDSDKVFCG